MIDWSQSLPDIALRAIPLFALAIAANVALFTRCARRSVATTGASLLFLGARILFFVTGMPLTMMLIIGVLVLLFRNAGLPVSWLDSYVAGGIVAVAAIWLLNLCHQIIANGVRWKMGLPTEPISLVNADIDWLGRPRRKPRRQPSKRRDARKPAPASFPTEES